MKLRPLVCTLALIAVGLAATTAFAGWREFHHRCQLDWHRSNVWPQPWVYHDRIATCQIFDIMAQNGWCQQSTLTAYHFDPVTHQLTEAGRNQVQQILTTHPPSFRTLFVVMGGSEEETALRVESVQQAASRLVVAGTLPQVQRVSIPPRGWPADNVNSIEQKFYETMPKPRLPNMSETSTTD